MSFWQTSDDVPPQIIQSCTNLCEREDCCLSARIGMSTCAGVSQSYNKQGMKIIINNNRFDADVCCRICWREWKVDKHDGSIIVKQVKGPLHVR